MKLLFLIFGVSAVLYGLVFFFLTHNEGAAVVALVAGASLIFASFSNRITKSGYAVKHARRLNDGR